MAPLLRAAVAAEMKSSLLLVLVSSLVSSPPLLVVGRRPDDVIGVGAFFDLSCFFFGRPCKIKIDCCTG